MPPLNISNFARLSQLRRADQDEVLVNKTGDALKTRGRLGSKLVEIFRPETAKKEHAAAAEAFLKSVEKELEQPGQVRDLLRGARLLDKADKHMVLSALRTKLDDQLSGTKRLTIGDLKAAIGSVEDQISLNLMGHAESIEAMAKGLIEDIDLAAGVFPGHQDESLRAIAERTISTGTLNANDHSTLEKWFNRFNDTTDKLDFIAADVGHLRELMKTRRNELKAELTNHVLGSPEYNWLSKELGEVTLAFIRVDHFEEFFASNRQALDLVAAKALAIAEFADDK